MPSTRNVSLLLLLCGTACAPAMGQAIVLALPTTARDVNADGTVVLGWGAGTSTYKFTISTDRLSIASTEEFTNAALGPTTSAMQLVALSRSGSVAVGRGFSTSGQEACRLNGSTITGMGDLAGGAFSSDAEGVSGDGSTIVGTGRSATGATAFVWTVGGGMVSMGDLAGGAISSGASAISGDGQAAVGFGTSANGIEAFQWTAWSGAMQGLGKMAGGTYSVATAVDWNGSTVVGTSGSTSGGQAFRWTSTTGMVGMGDLAGGAFESKAMDVSRNGLVIVGNSRGIVDGINANHAFIWRQDHDVQIKALETVLLDEYGLTVGPLLNATAISADGRTIVGNGWLVYLGPKCAADINDDGYVDINDLTAFQEAMQQGHARGDLDNGWGQGEWDGYVDINDLIYFLQRFEIGC